MSVVNYKKTIKINPFFELFIKRVFYKKISIIYVAKELTEPIFLFKIITYLSKNKFLFPKKIFIIFFPLLHKTIHPFRIDTVKIVYVNTT